MAAQVMLIVAGAGAAGWPLRVAAAVGLAALAWLLGDLLRRNRRAVARERVLSRVGSELLQAADPAAINRSAVAAALRLFGRDRRARASVVDGDLEVTSSRPIPVEVRDALDSLSRPGGAGAGPGVAHRGAGQARQRRPAKADAADTARLLDERMHDRAVQRLDFEAALRRAVVEQQFTVRYQPVVELAGGDVVGLEALVRWTIPSAAW